MSDGCSESATACRKGYCGGSAFSSAACSERKMFRCSFHALRASRAGEGAADRKSTRLNSSHVSISYAVFCLKKKKENRARVHADAAAERLLADRTLVIKNVARAPPPCRAPQRLEPLLELLLCNHHHPADQHA